jgi:hypothetical protein
MDNKLLNEEIQNMKFLFGYKPGRIISEQEQPELSEYDRQNGMDWVQTTTMDRPMDEPMDIDDIDDIDDNDDEGSVISILKKHRLLDNVVEPDNKKILLRNQSSKVVQKILSLLPSFSELTFLGIMDCESADFSGVDVCGLPELVFVNLIGTENNFEEQGYECTSTEDSPYYLIE